MLSVGIATVTQESFESQYYITQALFGTRSLFAMTAPACFKTSTIILVPKNQSIIGLRPVALTSVVMKTIVRPVLTHLKAVTDPLLDPLQFAYRANRSVHDAVHIAL